MKRLVFLFFFGLFAGSTVCMAEGIASDRLLLADGFFRRGMYDLAAREYSALSDAEKTAPVLFRLAECYRKLKKPVEADAVYCRVLELNPKGIERYRAQIQRAVLAMEGERFDAARVSFDSLTGDAVPVDIRQAAFYHLGECLERQSRTNEAVSAYDRLLKLKPESDYTGFGKMRLAWLLSCLPEKEPRTRAESLYRELSALQAKPEFAADALVKLARLAAEAGRREASAGFYVELRQRFPEQSVALAVAAEGVRACLEAERGIEALGLAEWGLAQASGDLRRELLLLKAMTLQYLSRYKDAVLVYDDFITAYPVSPDLPKARYGRIRAFYQDGRYEDVLTASAQLSTPPVEVADTLLWMQAGSAEKLNKPELAVQACSQLAEKYPDSPFADDALYRIGWLAQKSKNWTGASQAYLGLVAKKPQSELVPQALLASGVCLEQTGDTAGAIRDWSRLLLEYPQAAVVPEALYQKALVELRIKDFRAAALSLDELLSRYVKSERYAEAAFWRGSLASQDENLQRAEQLLKMAVERKLPESIDREARLQLGIVLFKLGREEEAAACFQPLLNLEMQQKIDPERLIWLAEFQLSRKNPQAALMAAQVLLDKWPGDVRKQTAHALRAKVFEQQGDFVKAAVEYRTALSINVRGSYAADAAYALAEILFKEHKYGEAEGYYKTTADFTPASEQVSLRARAYAGLMRTAVLLKKDEDAVRYAMTLAILFDDAELVPEALDTAAEIFIRTGRRQEAQGVINELLQRYPRSVRAAKRK